ncbi:glycosyltransferase family 2 protein [Sphingosinicella rhizophila]|uniref:Glycosyltransferase family A protein n=1 Tax=Sphingosinicella rhizophila TaxID=3050082 RepID=A0ABU3Q5Q2_9SPHN|nr:glycosyltransferase family A protein [Sphingosinicella sp. GR2756]MDT9598270.1 glycosyltransferase family A protein [Sphingosinicella sp. GR2756]
MIPPLSVVMPVHNALPFLDESIRSIIDQSFGAFEFVILDDGSTDGSGDLIRQWASRDRRIIPHFGREKLGPAGSSNKVVEHSNAPLVARMDADDLSHPDRLRRQMNLFARESSAGLIGTLWEGIDAAGDKVRSLDRWRLVRKSPFVPFPHGSVMFRRTVFDEVGGYRQECNYWEDLDLFLRIAGCRDILVIPESLYRHRFAQTSTRLSSPRPEVEAQVDLMLRCLGESGGRLDYEALLRDRPPPSDKVRPQVFLSLGSTILWAGRSPSNLKRIWRRADLRIDLASLKSMIWALWANFAPRSLRTCLRALVRARDISAGVILGHATAFKWRPNQDVTKCDNLGRD